MSQLTRKLTLASKMVRQRDFGEVSIALKEKAWSLEESLGMRRDMTVPFPAPQALFPIRIRAIRESDVQPLLDDSDPGLSVAERRDRTNRLHLLDAGFDNCFVGVTEDDRACYVQWLISSRENDLLRRTFGGLFPALQPDEMFLEGAYTPEAFRGQRIMPAAMALIAEEGARMGAASVITYVGADNIASIKGCTRAGFAPFANKQALSRFGHRRVTVLPLTHHQLATAAQR